MNRNRPDRPTRRFDGMAVAEAIMGKPPSRGRPATTEQRAEMERLGLSWALTPGLSSDKARELINEARREGGHK